MSRTQNDLDFSYESLDLVSDYVEGIGIDRAQHELYDHLVAYVGEVLGRACMGVGKSARTIRMPIRILWEPGMIPTCRSTWYGASCPVTPQ